LDFAQDMGEDPAAVETRCVRVCAAFPAGTRRMKMQRPKDETVGLAVAGVGRGELGQAARRALAEAEERRRPGALNQPAAAKEINGRDGPEPVRYGDWEVRGIASDF
jgi:hypothetical protein